MVPYNATRSTVLSRAIKEIRVSSEYYAYFNRALFAIFTAHLTVLMIHYVRKSISCFKAKDRHPCFTMLEATEEQGLVFPGILNLV